MQTKYKILGIDPGSYVLGFACLEAKKINPILPKDFAIAGAGAMRLNKKLKHADRLCHLCDSLGQLIDEFSPHTCVLEKSFFGVNAHSAIRMGETRGAIIAAIRQRQINLAEITPAQVKKAITGHGRGSKEQVSLALKQLMGFDGRGLPYDVSDALAIALSYALSLAIVGSHSPVSQICKGEPNENNADVFSSDCTDPCKHGIASTDRGF